jgi:hypothetical protein
MAEIFERGLPENTALHGGTSLENLSKAHHDPHRPEAALPWGSGAKEIQKASSYMPVIGIDAEHRASILTMSGSC